MTRHFLNIADVSKDEIVGLIFKAIDIKKDPSRFRDSLKDKYVGLYFQKPSMRTRVSFEVGISQLGAHAVNLHADEIRIGHREPIADVARVLSRYLDAIMLRVNRHSDLEEISKSSTIPVINGLSDLSHPCQALADMLTVYEHKNSFNVRIAYIGDGNNVCTSLIEICSALGAELVVSCPDGYEPAISTSHVHGSSYLFESSPEIAVKNADIVYTDVWTSMGQEAETLRRKKIFARYKVSMDLFAKAKPDAIFLHCLPAHRGEEVDDGVIESSRSVVFSQAENRLHAQKALLLMLLSS